MNAFQLHISALKKTFAILSNGNYLAFFIPGLIVGLIFWQVFLFSETFENIFDFLKDIPLLGKYLKSFIEGSFSLLNFILYQLFVFFVLTILSPFNTILGEKLDTQLTGKKYNFNFYRLLTDLIRMIFIVICALTLELLFMSVYWLISWITGLHFLDEPMYFLIGAFFYGLSFYDYSLERNKIGISGSFNFAFNNILLVTLTGCIFFAVFYIPIAGVVIAPVITTMISTIIYINFRKTKSNNIKA